MYGLYGVNKVKRVLHHFKECKECDPKAYLLSLKESMSIAKGTSKGLARLVTHFMRQWPNLQKTGAWFIINSYDWEVKVELSSYLTKNQVIEAIIQQAQKDRFNYSFSQFKLNWPTHSYISKFDKSGIRLPKHNNPREIENDKLFQRASLLMKNDILNWKGTHEDFLMLTDVAGILYD